MDFTLGEASEIFCLRSSNNVDYKTFNFFPKIKQTNKNKKNLKISIFSGNLNEGKPKKKKKVIHWSLCEGRAGGKESREFASSSSN